MDNRVMEEDNSAICNELEGKTQCASSQSLLNSRPSYHHETSHFDRANSINIIQDNFCDEPIVASLPTHLEEFPSRYRPEFSNGHQHHKEVDGEIGNPTDGTKRFEMFSFPTEYPMVTSTREMDNLRTFSEDNKTRSVLHDESRTYGSFQPRYSGCEVVLGDGSVTRWPTGPSLSFGQNRLSISDSTLNLNEPLIPTKQPPLTPTSPPSPYRWPLSNYKLTPSHKSVIKSTLSYFIGSMLTFIPALRATIGTSSHMAAISGFFLNPGMSVGKFVESMTFGIGFIVYGLTVGYLSLANMAFWNRQGYPEVGRRSTLFLFIGVASFILAYIKARYPKPTIIKCIPNAFIFIYLVLVNYTPFVEDSHNPFKIYDLAKALTSGILINFMVCTQLWPRWEADNLREDMVTTLNSSHTTLQAIVKTFLLENRDDKGIDKIMEAHRKSFLTLKQRYEATQWEFTLEPERYELLGNVVDRLNRLSQKLGGLSSSIDAQKELLQDFSLDARRLSKFPQFMNRYRQSDIIIDVDKVTKEPHPKDSDDPEPDVEVLTAFLKFVSLPTKSLVYTCQQAMLRLSQLVVLSETGHHHPPHHPSSQPGSPEFISLGQLRENINSALEIFSKAQSKAVSTLYRRTRYDGRPDEEIFLVYFFVFSLEEFANELVLTISAMEELSSVPPLPGSQRWILVRSLFSALRNGVHSLWTMAHDHLNEEPPESDSSAPLHSPAHQTFGQRLRAQFWYFLMSLRDHRFIFAAKAALAAMLIASPIYLGDQRENFRDWRVGWTMITVSLVMSPTLGASNIYGLYRSLGTVVGSLIAYIVYSIFSHNLFALATVSTLIAAPCMYVFLVTAYPRFGQFILLSYNLVVLTTYANRHDVEFSFAEYAFIRSFSVLLGVGIGLLFSFLIFPYEARKELRLGLSDFFLKTSSLYIKLVSMYSIPDPPGVSGVSSRVSIINEDPHYLASCGDFLEAELALQVQLLDLGGLLANTAHEPRLKGPFPIATYRRILQSCQVLLDKFVAMRVVITKEEWSARVRDDFVVPLNRYREDLVGSIILYFYLLASALHLKSPLPPFFPPAAHARRQLVSALRDLPVVRNRYLHRDDDHHIMYYAFVVVLDDIISELESLGTLFKQLYGCQGEAAFADLFQILDAHPPVPPSPTTPNCKLSPRPPSSPPTPRK